MDLNQYAAGFNYYYKLNANNQIGTGLEINLFNGPFNVTNRSFQEAYYTTDLSYFEELEPSLAYYLDVPLVFTHQFQMSNTSFKVEGGITNKLFLVADGYVYKRLQSPTFNDGRSRDFSGSSSRWIVPHGFRKYGVNSNTSVSYFLKTGMGFKLYIGVPIIKLGKSVSKIPSGETLFINNKQPMTIMIYFLCKF